MSKKDRWKKHDDDHKPWDDDHKRWDDDHRPWDDDHGGRGKGRIYGTQGDDTITGSSWNDKIYGLGGNDVIDGGGGKDKIYGGAGTDTFVFSGFFGNDKIEDAQTGEALVFRDLTTADLSFFSKKDDLYIVANDGSGRVEIDHYFRSTPDLTVNGESLADLLGGGSGGGGGGPGGGGGAGGDIVGSWRSERLYGTNGDDNIYGEGGNDRIYGGAGDDTIDGGTGNDKLYGQAGTDTFVFAGNFGYDKIEDAQAGEALVFQDLTTADLSFFSKGDDLYIQANDGSGRVEIDHYFRSTPDLTVNGESLADLLGAGAGSDIFGTDRSERLYGTFGDDFIDAAGGNDRVDAGAGDDEVHGGLGNDKLEGESGNDLLFGEEGNDKLEGGDGDDQLAGGAGNDTIEGDRGVDTAVFSGDSADFVVWGRGSRLFVDDANAADGDEGRDYVKEVEVLQFDDTTIDLTAVSPYELSGILAGGPITAADLDALITSAATV